MTKKINKEELLDKIVADYTRRTREGKAPEIAAYKRKYPSIADDIEDVLSSVAMIEGLKIETQTRDPSGDPARNTDISHLKQIGEYVLIREVGRGGMGIVYEAVHQALGRRVALKVMLEREFESEKQIARFRREAQAAARLHHTNIVSVFGVGEHDGYHYYVMEYVDGISLKSAVQSLTTIGVGKSEALGQTIGDQNLTIGDGDFSTVDNSELAFAEDTDPELSEPRGDTKRILVPKARDMDLFSSDPNRYRWVGKIGAQVADALGYSHEMGMLHRDIKPANLMLDDKGQVWITDFGLVKLADEEQLTQTGAVLGTPQYLAPESLKGQYDQKSETYCLGLSLYELATLKPAYAPGTHAEVFNRVINETPEAPQKIDPSIPRDLSTIIEKAISKDPKDRYNNAFELRDDLRAFLEDRPISARPLSLFEQGTRWARKNPVVASLGVLSALLVCATAIVASSAWAITQNAKNELQDQYTETKAAKEQAELARADAEIARDEAKVNEALAILNESIANDNLQLMVETFDSLFVEFLRKDSSDGAEKFDFNGFNELAGIEISIDESDAGYLKKMADFYERFAEQNADNAKLQQDAAKGWRRVANINFLIGEDRAAVDSYEKAVEGYLKLLANDPESIEALINLVSTRSEMSNAVRRNTGEIFGMPSMKPGFLINENLKAIDQHAHKDDPEVLFVKAESLTALASAEVSKLASENVVDFDPPANERRPAPKQPKPRLYDKHVKRSVEQAVQIASQLLQSDPENIDYRLLLARGHSSLGALELNFGDKMIAAASLGEAYELFNSLSKQHPENLNYRYQSALTLVLMPTDTGNPDAEEQIREVVKTADSLTEKTPRAEHTQLQIISRLKLADVLVETGSADKALEEFKDAVLFFKASNLEGAAKHSMARSFFKSVAKIRPVLSMNARREFMTFAQEELKEYFKRHRRSPRGGRGFGPPGRGRSREGQGGQ